MIQKVNVSSNDRYLITPSLLNSWLWIWNCEDSVVSSEKDTICLEDKVSIAKEKAIEDFVNTLNRVPLTPNKYMQEGIEFEEQCYNGETCISPIIDGGCFQLVGKKNVDVDGIKFLMYGRLDVLKGGVIYDIKRVFKYSIGKYQKSSQHRFYLDLFPNAKCFEYLVYDGNRLHRELYYRDNCVETEKIISQFIKWLKQNDLLNVYFEKWKTKEEN